MNRTILNQLLENITPTENKLLDYIQENLQIIEKMNIYQLAEEAGVSTATVSRISKKLGYANFNQLKIEIAKAKDDEFLNAHFTPSDSPAELVSKLINSITVSNQQTSSFLNIEVLQKAVHLLDQAQHIYLFGVGASGIVCSDLYYKLSRIGKTCVYSQDTHVQIANIASAKKNDLVIGISYSGSTKEVVEPLRLAKSLNIPIISISGTGRTPISTLSDLHFQIPRHEQELRVGAITSRSNTLFITDLLYLSLIQEDPQKIKKILERSKEMTQLLK